MESNIDHLSPVWHRYNDIIIERGDGCFLYDVEGEAYLDFTSGIGVANTGHAHPRVVEAVQSQVAKLLHGQINIVLHRPILDLIAELQQIVPSNMDGFFFSNSGAEAVEAAVKLARAATGRPNVIAFQGGFHGRTIGTMSMTTSKTIFRAGYQPLMPGVFFAPYPYSYRYGWAPEQTSNWCLNELRFLLETQTAPQETAALLIEPVLGEGGYVIPPPGFLAGLRQICDQHGMVLIVDEIQSGFGRTGRWFASDHFDGTPDIIIIGKGLASGLPISGIIASMELMQRWPSGSHGGTYGGNAVACAAAAETIRVLRDENLLENARVRGEQLTAGLTRLQKSHPEIGEVRGLGLMTAMEFSTADGKPDATLTSQVIQQARNSQMLLLSCGTFSNVIRLIPPLVVSQEQIAQGLEIVENALNQAKS